MRRQQGLARSRVQMIVWNEIDVYKNAASPVSVLQPASDMQCCGAVVLTCSSDSCSTGFRVDHAAKGCPGRDWNAEWPRH